MQNNENIILHENDSFSELRKAFPWIFSAFERFSLKYLEDIIFGVFLAHIRLFSVHFHNECIVHFSGPEKPSADPENVPPDRKFSLIQIYDQCASNEPKMKELPIRNSENEAPTDDSILVHTRKFVIQF